MSAMIDIVVERAANLLGNIAGWRSLLTKVLISFALSSVHVMASTTTTPITLSVYVLNAPGGWDYLSRPTYMAIVRPGFPPLPPPDTLSYVFIAQLQIPGAFLPKGDLYFGFIPPGGNQIFTWTGDGGTPSLKEGFFPVARALDLKTAASFSVSSLLGQEIQYVFTGGELPGLYLLFGLLVASGTDPTNPANWFAADTWPLIFRP